LHLFQSSITIQNLKTLHLIYKTLL